MSKNKLGILDGKIREAGAKVTRRQGDVPGILYGHGISSQSVSVNAKQFSKVLKTAGYASLVSLKLGDKDEHTVLIRDVAFHPLNDSIIHADFYQVRMDEKIEANVPLHFIGEAAAVKNLGGVLIRNIDELEVSALPADLPPHIEIDISVLSEFGKAIRVSDLALPSGITVSHDADDVIALVQEPRTEQELEQLSGEVKEDVEAVEGVKKEEIAAEGEGEATPKTKDKDEKKE
ncbi:MAG: 50S ribosomal protein L25 [Candidatus Sungbacteria bacterium]|nr:50S ribosomal protein L25 [Candidatus Sungbacteria bacterium]